MTSFLLVFTLTSVASQTGLSLLIGWLTLECQLQPEDDELQEVTIIKLLYLYDPQACGKVFFYNYTILLKHIIPVTTVQWPVKNDIAGAFRQKIKIHVATHILWLVFFIVYMTQGHKPFGFYSALLPFTLTGVTILALDILYTALFLADTSLTNSEEAILKYINIKNDSIYHISDRLRTMNAEIVLEPKDLLDTSWISLLFAYVSCRGIVVWILNFWMVKDNYFTGLAVFRSFDTVLDKKKAMSSTESLHSKV